LQRRVLARKLADLATIAEELEIPRALDMPLADVACSSAIPEWFADLLFDLDQHIPSLGELATTPFTAIEALNAEPPSERLMAQRLAEFLVALEEGGHEHLRSGASRPVSAAVPAVSGPYYKMSHEDLRAWAAERGIDRWLRVPASILASRDVESAAFRWLGRLGDRVTIEELICGARSVVPEHARLLAETAIEFLHERLTLAEDAIREETEWLGSLPAIENTELEQARRRLLLLRTHLRETALPRQRENLGRIQWGTIESPPSIYYREQVQAWCGGGAVEPSVRVTLGSETTPASVRCDCPKPGAPCSVHLAAVDHVIRLLSGEADPRSAGRIRELLLTRPWQRALAQIANAVEGLPAPPDEIDGRPAAFGWEIKLGARLEIYPIIVRASKKGDRTLTKRVGWNEARAWRTSAPLAADRQVLRVFGAAQAIGTAPDELMGGLLPLLEGHPRVYVRAGSPVRVDVRHTPIHLSAISNDDDGFELSLTMDGQPVSRDQLQGSLARRSGTLVEIDDELGIVRYSALSEGVRAVLPALVRYGSRFPADAVHDLVSLLPQLAEALPLRLSPDIGGQRVAPDLTPIVRLSLEPSVTGEAVLRVGMYFRPLPESDLHLPGEGPELAFARRDGQTVQAVRRRGEERAVASRLAERLELPETREGAVAEWLLETSDAALALVERLGAASEGVLVEWARDRSLALVRTSSLRDLRVRVGDLGRWFSVGGGLEIDGQIVPLAQLLAAVREQRRFVRVDGDRWVRLGDELAKALEPAADALEGTGDELEASLAASLLLDDLAGAGVEVEGSERWFSLIQRLHDAEHLEPELPETLVGELRPYQLDGYRWLARLASWAPGACLADDMGLGKTVQALALLLRRADGGPTLVVAPTSVGFNWAREAARFAPSLSLRRFTSKTDIDVFEGLGPSAVVISSYELLHRHLERIREVPWHTVVLDESQAIKNPSTRRAKAVFALEPAFCLALTGTPLENYTGELWSLFRAIAPGLLGSYSRFRTRFARPIERLGETAPRERLATLIRPFVLRRLKSEVARDLPPRTEINLEIALSDEERKLYDDLRASALRELATVGGESAGQQRFRLLAAITHLRQLACHPRLFDPASKVESSKLAAVREILGTLVDEGHRALVFSQFTQHLALVREVLDADGVRYRYLDGSTPEAKRREEVDAFQAGMADVFLLSLKAGGTGLNLTAADYVLLLDPWWNPAVEDQATDRTHRIGQTQPVTVYRFVTVGTIEEGILAMHAEKRALVSDLLAGTGTATALTTDELMALLAGELTDEPGGPRRPAPIGIDQSSMA
jgi:hypothetical protein